ncbi:uncharacterized protein LOC117733788 [Cyclopterus lumpus]|uniref:uncharacterized protein LOC117733788 n=1 Tax=Cyclopterus lumpus TaxID=8103 RepID=UPI0014870A36|nr:uncharacterized protein LOC117733788 [Cyclopterus lumpus]
MRCLVVFVLLGRHMQHLTEFLVLDPEESDSRKKNSQPNSGSRRRVSITLIPSHIQEKIKRDEKRQAPPGRDSFLTCSSPPPLNSESSCSAMTRDDSLPVDDRQLDQEETLSEAPAVELLPPPPPSPECIPSKQLATRKLRTTCSNKNNKNFPLDTLRQRHKGKSALSKKKADKDKKSSNIYRRLSMSTCGSSWRPRPLAHWLYRRRWPLLCMYLLVLFGGVALLTCFLWKLHNEAPEP